MTKEYNYKVIKIMLQLVKNFRNSKIYRHILQRRKCISAERLQLKGSPGGGRCTKGTWGEDPRTPIIH